MQAQSVNISEDGKSLIVEWQSGNQDIIDARRLWCDCPSAHAHRRRMEHPDIEPDANLRIASVAPIGLYAINIRFSDGHDRGIYPWSFLRKLANPPTMADFLIN